jgi:hypothetical protein
MTSNIVEFPNPAEMLWVCDCGCMTHLVYVDGRSVCASCGEEDERGWVQVQPAGDDPGDIEMHRVQHYEDGSEGQAFSLQRVAQRVSAGEFLAVVGFRAEGGMTTWRADRFETPQQRGWLLRRLREAYSSLTERG